MNKNMPQRAQRGMRLRIRNLFFLAFVLFVPLCLNLSAGGHDRIALNADRVPSARVPSFAYWLLYAPPMQIAAALSPMDAKPTLDAPTPTPAASTDVVISTEKANDAAKILIWLAEKAGYANYIPVLFSILTGLAIIFRAVAQYLPAKYQHWIMWFLPVITSLKTLNPHVGNGSDDES